MKKNAKITYRLPQFFTPTMHTTLMACSLFAQMAHLDDMLRTAAKRGANSCGIDVIWRAFPNAVPNFESSDRADPCRGNTVVIQAEMSGPILPSAGVAKKARTYTSLTATFCVRRDGNITRLTPIGTTPS